MDINLTIAILVLIGTILTVLGGLLGYFIKDFLDKKREINSENIKVKREMYKKFVNLVIDLFKKSKANTSGQRVVIDIKDELYEFYKDYCLYSSPEVINSFGDFMQHAYKNPHSLDHKTTLSKLGAVIKSMRNEVGLSNKDLGENDEKIFRSMFNDFNKMFEEK